MAEIIIYREKAWVGVLNDIIGYTGIGALLYANHRWFGDHVLVALAFVAIVIFMVGTRSSRWARTFDSKEAAKKYIDKIQ